MNNWKQMFTSKILDRGYAYYTDGLVEDLFRDGDTITAVVNGTEDYEVAIIFDGNEIEELFCTCPYAEDGFYCKHMAAVLYELEDTKEVPVKNNSANQDITEMVNSADEQYVRDFLANILKENELICQRFMMMLPNQRKRSVKDYKAFVDAIIRSHTNHSGYVEYRDAEAMIDELLDIVYDLDLLIKDGRALDAFEISLYILQETQGTDPEHEDVYLLYDHLAEYWYKIAETATAEEKNIIFERLFNGINHRLYPDEYIRTFLFHAFREPRYLPKLFETLDSEIESVKHDRYQYGNMVLRKLNLMSETGTDFTVIEKTCREYWDSDSARQWLAKHYELRGQIQDAIQVYEEGIQLDREYRGLVNQYREKLLRLYQQIGNDEKYMEYLWLLVTDGEKEYYRELKSHYTDEEWQCEREKVFQCYFSLALADMYCEEKLYDRLWELLKEKDLQMILGYEDVLLPKYASEILTKYRYSLNRAATQASNRSTYQEWVRLLKRMEKIDGGKELAQQIANEWRVKYRNRRAMMEELSKL